jgi:hypothetical protein
MPNRRRVTVTEGDVCYRYFTAPAGLKAHGIEEGDLVVLNRNAERLVLVTEVPMALLGKLGAPVGELTGRLAYHVIASGSAGTPRPATGAA